MIISVVYYDEKLKGYGGREYTYRTGLPLKVFQKVFAPTIDGVKKALVVEVDLPESVIDPAWADRVKEIKEIDV